MTFRCAGLPVGLLLLLLCCCIPVTSLVAACSTPLRAHTARSTGRSSARRPNRHEGLPARQLLHHEVVEDLGAQVLQQWYQNTTLFPRKQGSSCFSSGTVHKAAGIQDFIRLVTDPTVKQIQLVGPIVFSSDLFPLHHSNDMTKGVNISHTVAIRSCSSPDQPIIVDANHVFRQVYVWGKMTWQGSIKFINSYPSLRRGGIWALVSVLSIERAGVIHLLGVHIHGYEPSALFDEHDPYWELHNDSAFAPQPHQYTRISSTAMIMDRWVFNRTAWLHHSQGAHGLIQSTGDGYWLFKDVLLSYSPMARASSGVRLQGTALALAVVLPLVFGVLLLAGGAVLVWWCCRKAAIRPPTPGKGSPVAKQVTPFAGGGADSIHTSTNNSLSGLSSLQLDSTPPGRATHDLIEATRLRMRSIPGLADGSLVLHGLLGEGAFGKVYSGVWKGTSVAVKTMLLPAAMSGKERREKMAIMETAISSSLSHPNIVQTYTYEVKALTGELSRKDTGTTDGMWIGTGTDDSSGPTSGTGSDSQFDCHGWEVRLVLELMDQGSLQQLLRKGGFRRPCGQVDMAALLETAMEVSRACMHLHHCNIIHGDLKASNVLLKSAAAAPNARGFIAKVSDFGLSSSIDPAATHVSNVFQGTLCYMAPETLLHAKLSFASDVFAFGITLYEMYTGTQAYPGLPRALLGHEVAKLGRRPEFPPECPFDYQLLACRCWESDPAIRPTFDQILSHLKAMHKRVQDSADSTASLSGAAPPWSSSDGSNTPPAGPHPALFAPLGEQLPLQQHKAQAPDQPQQQQQLQIDTLQLPDNLRSCQQPPQPSQQQQQQQGSGEPGCKAPHHLRASPAADIAPAGSTASAAAVTVGAGEAAVAAVKTAAATLPNAQEAAAVSGDSGGLLAAGVGSGHPNGQSLGSWGGVGGVSQLSGSMGPEEMQQAGMNGQGQYSVQQQQQQRQPGMSGQGASLGSWGGVGGVWQLSGSMAPEGMHQGGLSAPATGAAQQALQQQQQQQLQRGVSGQRPSLGSWGGVGGLWDLSGSMAPVGTQQEMQQGLLQQQQQQPPMHPHQQQ